MDKKYLKLMFGTAKEPVINFSLPEISLKAQEMVGKLSISGVQPKLSVKLDNKKRELIAVAKEGEYILKPQTDRFPNIPENEDCCMNIAESLGIDVPLHCLLRLSDASFVYVVKRFDRRGIEKIHQEDFSQILGKDKYDGSLEQIGKKLKEISAVPGLDVQLFFERVILNFLIGIGDAHLKNFSINYDNQYQIRLSPAYDIVCSKLVIPDEEDSALTLSGKKNKLAKSDFDALADYLKVPSKVRYEKFIAKATQITGIIRASKLKKEAQEKFIDIVKARYQRMGLE